MLLKIHSENPSQRQIQRVAETLRNNGMIIYPTDTVYALGWSIHNTKSGDGIRKIGKDKKNDGNFSLICSDLSQASEFTKQINKSTFKLLKHNLPGPFTFILPASNKVPQIYQSRKKTVGIRIPNNRIPLEIVRELGHPIMTTSLHDNEDEILDYMIDPEQIFERYDKMVDIIIDGGQGSLEASTVVDCTGDEPLLVREGLGELVV
jgi:tRNA threonylcarbamoyl adenosine modification protein (Sua5/YciO/YrdC/YwlC family)